MANRYWVGGTASWDATAGTKWALTSGGAGGQAVPTASDDVFFDGASGTVTCTIGAASVAKSVTCTGFTGTIAGSSTLAVSGSYILASGMAGYTYTGTLTINNTSGTATIDSGGKTMDHPFTFNGAGGTFQLAQNITGGATRVLTLTAGTLDLNGYTFATGTFASTGTGVRTLAFGSGTLELTNASGATTIYNTTDATNLTITGQTTGLISVTGANTSTRTIVMDISPLVLAPSITVSAGSGTVTFTNANCYDFTAGSGYTGILNGGLSVYNDFTMHANNADTTLALSMRATSGTHTINCAGKPLSSLTINGVGGTFELPSSLSMTSSMVVTGGTFNTNNHAITAFSLTGTGASAAAFNLGTSHVTLTASGVVWQVTNVNLTLSASSSTIELTDNSSSTKNVYLGGKTIGELYVNTGGTGAVAIRDSLGTIGTLRINPGRTMEFTNSSTTTVNNFNAVGSSGNVITLRTLSDAASNWSIVYGGVGVVSCDWLSVKRSQASPADAWYAGANSTDVGNNTGWIFTAPPSATGHSNLLLLGVG